MFKTRVTRFYLFFNYKFSILKAKRFDGKWHFKWFNAKTPEEWEQYPDSTMFGIGWIPLGGYCDIAGMIDESKNSKDMESTPQPWEYRSKKAWQRLLIISGGVLVNFVAAMVIYIAVLFHWGEAKLPLKNATMGYNYAEILQENGFRNGDIILAIDGKEKADTYSARAGHSEHQTGLAIDISRRDIGLTSNFMFTNEYLYLKNNAHRFGFINRYPMDKEIITGYLFEPWHYRFVGVDIATEIYLNNITLEEYLA